jgi:hypothetical protein
MANQSARQIFENIKNGIILDSVTIKTKPDKTSINDFIKSIQVEFGAVSYKATSPEGKIYLKAWPTNPHHPANRNDGVKPVLKGDVVLPMVKKRKK